MPRFYVIEYVDDEGDQVVKHALLEPEEAAMLVDEMARSGTSGSVTDLSPEGGMPLLAIQCLE
jgi:hypothetical protein